MTYAVIDIGSNTVRLCIYRYQKKTLTRLLNTKETVGLAGYRNKGRLTDEGIDKACTVLNEFKHILSIVKVTGLYVFATASLRNISNSKEAVEEICKRTGFEIDLISGEEEATLDFVGASKENNLKNGLLVDIGGGSTELLEYKDGKILNAISIPIGSLSLYSVFVTGIVPKKSELKSISGYVNELLDGISFLQNKSFDTILGIGGSIRTVKKLCYQVNHIEEKAFSSRELDDIMKLAIDNKKQALELVLREAPERVHTAIPGMVILKEISDRVNVKEIVVSGFGVREGYLYSKIIHE